MQAFDYAAPPTVAAAIELLRRDGARAMAGGTDLLVQMKERRTVAEFVVDLKRIPDLNRLAYSSGDGLRVGAAVPVSRLWQHPEVKRIYPTLAYCSSLIGSWQIQNRATLGGNLCNASPAADGIPGLIVYGAEAVVNGPGGERRVPVAQFCTAPGRTVLEPGEVLVELVVPPPMPHFGSAYQRFTAREEMDIAVVGVGAGLAVDPVTKRITAARIALGAVAPTPLRATAVEEALIGQEPAEAVLTRAAEVAANSVRPISDVRASAEYRTHLVRVLTDRVLRAALAATQPGEA